MFACYQYGNCFRSVNGGNRNTFFSGGTTASRRNWFTPVQFDPNNPNVMYYGGDRLNRSVDNGVTWTPISPDLTGGPGQDAYPFGTITTVAAAASAPSTLWVGTDDGRVWVTPDLGATWTLRLSGQPWVTRVAVDPGNAAVAYVTLSSYRSGSYLPHVLVTRDGGATWTDLTGNLPQAPVNDVVLAVGGALYVATDQGVFVSAAGDGVWLRALALGAERPLPRCPLRHPVPCGHLERHRRAFAHRSYDAPVGPAGHRRQPGGRLRHDRRGVRREGAARRIYAAPLQHRSERDFPVDDRQAALRA